MEVENTSKKLDEEELERLAVQELLNEAKRGAERAKEMGPAGWVKPIVPSTNKKFLENTIKSAARSTRLGIRRNRSDSEDSPDIGHRGSHRDNRAQDYNVTHNTGHRWSHRESIPNNRQTYERGERRRYRSRSRSPRKHSPSRSPHKRSRMHSDRKRHSSSNHEEKKDKKNDYGSPHLKHQKLEAVTSDVKSEGQDDKEDALQKSDSHVELYKENDGKESEKENEEHLGNGISKIKSNENIDNKNQTMDVCNQTGNKVDKNDIDESNTTSEISKTALDGHDNESNSGIEIENLSTDHTTKLIDKSETGVKLDASLLLDKGEVSEPPSSLTKQTSNDKSGSDSKDKHQTTENKGRKHKHKKKKEKKKKKKKSKHSHSRKH